jgi:hypothetical protein
VLDHLWSLDRQEKLGKLFELLAVKAKTHRADGEKPPFD